MRGTGRGHGGTRGGALFLITNARQQTVDEGLLLLEPGVELAQLCWGGSSLRWLLNLHQFLI